MIAVFILLAAIMVYTFVAAVVVESLDPLAWDNRERPHPTAVVGVFWPISLIVLVAITPAMLGTRLGVAIKQRGK